MRKTFWYYVATLLIVTPGCGANERYAATESRGEYDTAQAVAASPPPPRTYAALSTRSDLAASEAVAGMMGGMMGGYSPMMAQAATPAFAGQDQAAFPEGEPTAESPPAIPRKIIYQAEVSVVVEDFEGTEAEIARLVEESGGYIAGLNETGSPGSRRGARWEVRIPVDSFEAFLREVVALGELETNRRTSQDVTEEYYDVEARVRNKRVEEERLIEILEQTTGKLEDVLRVEAELSRVRGEIEQLQGRLRVLANLTALTTVTIQVQERVTFEPPPPVAPDFATQVSRTFEDSLKELRELGQSIVLFFVDWGLWILVVILPAILVGLVVLRVVLRVVFRMIRRAWESARAAPAAPRAS